MRINKRQKTTAGFALLLTLVVISIVLAVGLSLLQITVKQLSLSSIARESTVAIYAANSGIECIQYHRLVPETLEKFLRDDTVGWPPTVQCADVNPTWTATQTLIDNDQGRFLYNYKYRYELDQGSSGTADDACMEVSLYVADMRQATANIDYTVADEGLATISCNANTASVCTTIFSRGFNRPCDQLNSIFTVQREFTVTY